MDRRKLAKLMEMTTSSHDGEALTAMRMANKVVVDSGETWTQILSAPSAPPRPPRDHFDIQRDRLGRFVGPGISLLFSRLDDLGVIEGNVFVASLREWHGARGFLSRKQLERLIELAKWQGVIVDVDLGEARNG